MKSRNSVLISGGAGYIGSHTAVELISACYDVVIIDNFSNSDKNAIAGIEKIIGKEVKFAKVDTCDKNELRKIFEKYPF